MANKKKDSLGKEKEAPKIEVHDLKPKRNVKGGTRNGAGGEKPSSTQTGEIDFMNLD